MLKASIIGALAMAASAGSTSLLGNWAGSGIGMKVTAEGAVMSFDCASIRISKPLELGSDGNFTAEARASHYKPGPQLADQPTAESVSRVSGVLHGNVLSLTVTEPGRPPASYALQRNARLKLRRCL